MQIGELSDRTGASRRSIRYYEQQGLLEAARTSKGWREYGEQAVNRVLNVRALLAAGLTVEDIRVVVPCLDMKTEEFLACDDGPDEVLVVYEQRLAVVEARAAELRRHRTELVARIARLRAGASSPEDFARSLSSTDA
ncbi:MerR family transcriptional regulator [Streptomyces alkaliterrae]|uniref:MerR family transcriptional regulator n=1 Tax=Streptomyces alkaliterrae TaxID=2213162 RepID=A0A5P0YQV2_9ACTN|nr:MerR family transcriptional regulator [Streptomyces alkaliterrae]MBB1258720.1 MerR family transcriptional regulator [Streptomyces alkaliterrae]MQS02694.1 MerR family transcriptional regulator [Streptomyces alkaliterrae]